MNKSIDILSRTLYGEARGEYERRDGGISSLIAVGNVIINRVQRQSHFGLTVDEVCLKPYQFSCWNLDDHNRAKLEAVHESDPILKICSQVARGVLMEHWPDLTKGSTHYYANWLQRPPKWATNKKPQVKIGQHLFFKLDS